MIDRIIIPNLKRHDDKWYFILGVLHHAGVNLKDKDFIIRHISHDGRDYRDDFEVRDAAIADGFKYFANYDRQHDRLSATNMAWLWTWNSAMRVIAEMPNESIVLFLIDDVYVAINWRWGRIRELAHEVVHAEGHGEFKGLQLHHDIDTPEYRPSTPLMNSSGLSYGWLTYSDLALLLSPAGAEILMEVFASFKQVPNTTNDIIEAILVRGAKDDKFYKGFWHMEDSIFTHGNFFNSGIGKKYMEVSS